MNEILALIFYVLIFSAILHSLSIPFRKSWAERRLFEKFLTSLVFIYQTLCILIIIIYPLYFLGLVNIFPLSIGSLFFYITIHFFFIQKKEENTPRTKYEKLVTLLFFLSLLFIPFFVLHLFLGSIIHSFG